MDYPQWLPVSASIALAVIPVVIWLKIIRKQGEEKSLYIKTFIFGTLSVIPPFILIFLFEWFPQLNIYSAINRGIQAAALAALVTNIIVGIVEEIAKNVIVRVIDKRHPEYIQTISAALKLSICAGLGFSFAENIFYFYNIWVNQYGFGALFSTFIFRSMFTMLGHMVFSGIFGYYFGIGKFAADITEQARWEGSSMRFVHFLSKTTGRMPFQVVRELKNLKGLFLAMSLHATFNATLDMGYKLPAIMIVVLSAVYIFYLMKTRSGHLLFSITKRKASNMAPKDEDVVIELLGMWTNEGKLEEVIQICDRLLKRDPDNNVVKLFRAKATDNQKLRQFYNSLKTVFKKDKTQTPSAVAQTQQTESISLPINDEKVVLEVMDMWYKQGNYKQVLEISNRLLERNPKSEGAKLLLQKAMDKEKMRKVFDSLSRLFEE